MADHKLQQQPRANKELNDMGVYPFEDDQSEYSCVTGPLSLHSHFGAHSNYSQALPTVGLHNFPRQTGFSAQKQSELAGANATNSTTTFSVMQSHTERVQPLESDSSSYNQQSAELQALEHAHMMDQKNRNKQL
jgi:hypothetical protein